jgi:2-hydroxy-3-keto-5-methylthiopentenyl-1-phosphate phosphatase
MSHAECFTRQIGLIRAPRADIVRRLLEVAEAMPGLRDFFMRLLARGGEAAIVSAGIREAIEAFWARNDLPPVELFASELVGAGPDGGPPYHLEFSTALGDCPRCGPRSCKAAIVHRLRRPGDIVLVFGDGPSDLCPAREADLVFARGHLAERCEQEGLEWRPLTDFGAVLGEVDAWLARR